MSDDLKNSNDLKPDDFKDKGETYSVDNTQTVTANEATNGIDNAYSEESFDLDGLSAYMKSQVTERAGRGVPPLEKWHPERCGSMDLVIKANGDWWHEGSKILRESLVQLFSSVLWLEESEGMPQYYLKTPVEKLLITVEDVPFLINDVNIVDKEGVSWLEFVSKTGDVVYLDKTHPIVMRKYKGEMRPYIEVRFGMYGLISRSVLMHLIRLGKLSDSEGVTTLTLQSGGDTYHVTVTENN